MAKVIMTCGRVCSGKSTYARKLSRKTGAVILSDDEIMLALFGNDAGQAHDEYSRRLQSCLMNKSLEITALGIDVILDWGFWTRAARKGAREFYRANGVECEFHYIDVPDGVWLERIKARNSEFAAEKPAVYYVDEGLVKKCLERFEKPDRDEMDRWIEAR